MEENKISAVKQMYRKKGVKGIVNSAWIYGLLHTSAGSIIEAVFDETLREKLTSFPTLGYWPHIENPRSFNEKLLHRKLFTDEQLYTVVADKSRVREYVNDRVGPDVLNKVYQETADPDRIDFASLPERFVIKATQGSGFNIIVENKQDINEEAIRQKCERFLNTSYGSRTGEYWYSRINPKIIIEKYIQSTRYEIPLDYKFYVFGGEVKYIHVDMGRHSDHSRRFYDRNWNPQEFTLKYPLAPVIDEPYDLNSMIGTTEELGEDFDFIRVDLYNPQRGEIVFGEMTVAPGNGRERFKPKEWDFEFGKHW